VSKLHWGLRDKRRTGEGNDDDDVATRRIVEYAEEKQWDTRASSAVFPLFFSGGLDIFLEGSGFCSIGNLGLWWSVEICASWVTPESVCVCGELRRESMGCDSLAFRWSWECREERSRPQDHRHGCTWPQISQRTVFPPSPSPSAWFHCA